MCLALSGCVTNQQDWKSLRPSLAILHVTARKTEARTLLLRRAGNDRWAWLALCPFMVLGPDVPAYRDLAGFATRRFIGRADSELVSGTAEDCHRASLVPPFL